MFHALWTLVEPLFALDITQRAHRGGARNSAMSFSSFPTGHGDIHVLNPNLSVGKSPN